MAKLFATHSALEQAVSQARRQARADIESDFGPGCWFSRGTWLLSVNSSGPVGPLDENVPNTEWETKKALDKVIANILENHPEVDELWVCGGWDFAESVQAYNDGCYDVTEADWTLCVWKRGEA